MPVITTLLLRLKYTPINSFAITMGLIGLSIAWQKFSFISGFPYVSQALGVFSTLIFSILLCAYLYKVLFHSCAVKTEWNNPVLQNFYPAISISFLLLSTFWRSSVIGESLWLIGTILQALLTLSIITQWLLKPRGVIARINPTWYLPAVGNIIVPTSGSYFGYSFLSTVFFYIGVFFWIALTVILLIRFVKKIALPAPLTPSYFIFLAPPSLGFISYISMGNLSPLGIYGLYGFSFGVLALLFINQGLFVKLPFMLSSWAYSFPLTAFTSASFIMAGLYKSVFWNSFAIAMLVITTLIIFWLALNTIKAYINSKIFIAENA